MDVNQAAAAEARKQKIRNLEFSLFGEKQNDVSLKLKETLETLLNMLCHVFIIHRRELSDCQILNLWTSTMNAMTMFTKKRPSKRDPEVILEHRPPSTMNLKKE